VPASVTLALGERNAVFSLNPIDNDLLDGTRRVVIQASASNYATVSASIDVLDNDSASLVLTAADAVVTEGAPSPATIGTVSRSPVTSRAMQVSLTPASPLSTPFRVTIPAGEAFATFNINASDDGFVNGTRTASLTARIVNDVGTIIDEGAATVSIQVLDNDGPTLSFSMASDVVAEGATVSATVYRNTDPAAALVVSLSSSAPGQATVRQA